MCSSSLQDSWSDSVGQTDTRENHGLFRLLMLWRLSSIVSPDNFDTDDLTECPLLTGVFAFLGFNIFPWLGFFISNPSAASIPCSAVCLLPHFSYFCLLQIFHCFSAVFCLSPRCATGPYLGRTSWTLGQGQVIQSCKAGVINTTLC